MIEILSVSGARASAGTKPILIEEKPRSYSDPVYERQDEVQQPQTAWGAGSALIRDLGGGHRVVNHTKDAFAPD
jgi:hypothetical protein